MLPEDLNGYNDQEGINAKLTSLENKLTEMQAEMQLAENSLAIYW